ncbi:MAG: hypothetical protein WCV70_01520 [Patescibacteria group bacterium]|jgi:hypothetical protein
MAKKKIEPIRFNLRKFEISRKRMKIMASGQSSMEEAYRMRLKVDPTLAKTIGLSERYYRLPKKQKGGKK